MTRITAGRYTTTVDVNHADDTTYQNWRTFRLTWNAKGTYVLGVLSNKDGNGQQWDAIGTIKDNHLTITDLASHSTPFSHDALLLTCVSLFASHRGMTCNANAPGTFDNAKTWKIKTGSKRTAAPTLLRPTMVRDRNVNNARSAARRNANDLMAFGATQWNANETVECGKDIYEPELGHYPCSDPKDHNGFCGGMDPKMGGVGFEGF